MSTANRARVVQQRLREKICVFAFVYLKEVPNSRAVRVTVENAVEGAACTRRPEKAKTWVRLRKDIIFSFCAQSDSESMSHAPLRSRPSQERERRDAPREPAAFPPYLSLRPAARPRPPVRRVAVSRRGGGNGNTARRFAGVSPAGRSGKKTGSNLKKRTESRTESLASTVAEGSVNVKKKGTASARNIGRDNCICF